jgi:hypothetical protein
MFCAVDNLMLKPTVSEEKGYMVRATDTRTELQKKNGGKSN